MIPGLRRVPKFIQTDNRGRFEKFFSGDSDLPGGLSWKESFSSVSQEGTIRGMHLQAPPFEHFRLVSCSEGRILDVCVDLRIGSPSHTRVHSEVLDSTTSHSLLIPPGVAHGFAVLEGPARVVYFSTSVFSSENDTGVAWNSIGFDWNISEPIVSERDRLLRPLQEFDSPFVFNP